MHISLWFFLGLRVINTCFSGTILVTPHVRSKVHLLTSTKSPYLNTMCILTLMIFLRDYTPDVSIKGAFFDRIPYFILVGDLGRKNKALTAAIRELRETNEKIKASSKVTIRMHVIRFQSCILPPSVERKGSLVRR
jgi:hypothetical protein